METTARERIAFLGGFAPRQCGIATFTTDLCESVSLAAPDSECYSGAVNDRFEGYRYPDRVRFELLETDLDSYRRAADFLNFDNAGVLCVQHEFGIYGGPSGSYLLALLKEVRMPVVTTLHTVLDNPSASQRTVMDELAHRSDRLVVMAEKGAQILYETYGVPWNKVDVIPHGIPDIPFQSSEVFKAQFGVEGRKVLLTFGLLGPGKGIEYAIEALPEIVRVHPEAVYLILGATHPHLIAHEGERYRLSLERLAEDCGVREQVIFYNRFVSPDDLTQFIGATDVYLTPYLNEAQITSGTLAYVFGAGKAVVSTPYWHAKELLAHGRGTLVPFRDPEAIARAVCEYLDDTDATDRVRREAYQNGRKMIWPTVARQYLEAFRRARSDLPTPARRAFAGWTLAGRPYELPQLRFDHLQRMTDQTGIFQHALFNVPNFHEGYCTDDNARAFLLCVLLDQAGPLATTYLAFLAAALQRPSRRFRNFMDHSRHWLEEEGSEESHGRALWALGAGAARSKDEGRRRLAVQLFDHALSPVTAFSSPRAWAFALLGLHEYLSVYHDNAPASEIRAKLTGLLVGLWKVGSGEDWPWFEGQVTYENARLSQALIQAGRSIPHPEALEIGLKSLGWLISIQKTQAGNFRPIGNDGFYVRGGARADFDQQPVEAQAMVSGCLEAFHATGDVVWFDEARRAFEWFLGRNDIGIALYDPVTGGCSDGLHNDRINENQGAESSLAFLLSLAEMKAGSP